MKTMSYEEIIADELIDGIEFPSTAGWVEFDKTIELDDDTVVEVVGCIEYETAYEPSTNYFYNTFVSTEIEEVMVSSERGITVNKEKLTKLINRKLMRV